jgi:hypothetical protein
LNTQAEKPKASRIGGGGEIRKPLR